ncbi:hypothetical protein BC939DRAFT_115398 [Gamsiella multidivaricata]|uniref:uncharacterized protein n=1 Tax=Gamsiella multidivaricata TaxID=101098 RepID=UPI00221EFF59|nr:uncharacterized protein BC939DRAFT_115398 [Gamsiella multidivaricata]KAI7826147.1 hypothetical protein BC939DRAFT_115398 [Gamsiella multidivaricata]
MPQENASLTHRHHTSCLLILSISILILIHSHSVQLCLKSPPAPRDPPLRCSRHSYLRPTFALLLRLRRRRRPYFRPLRPSSWHAYFTPYLYHIIYNEYRIDIGPEYLSIFRKHSHLFRRYIPYNNHNLNNSFITQYLHLEISLACRCDIRTTRPWSFLS